ncbi:DUF6716 putative glycosyltransferase [Coralliovum pocilloporae]|uniref:DUF6716 putative glycosyltransferase n=1 Tax=Coralliovum pocilloporae TaxID=3066369 RepID=UPI003307B7B1
MRILAVGSYDSFIRTVTTIGKAFAARGAEVDLALVKVRSQQISGKQLDQMDIPFRLFHHSMDSLSSREVLENYDILIMSLDGSSFRRFFLRLQDYQGPRPCIVAMYPGLVLRYAFDGLSSRAPADFLWLNSRQDLESYRSMCDAFGYDGSNARDFGLVSALQKIERRAGDNKSRKRMVFFEQAVIPRAYDDRKYLTEQLVALARRYPDWDLFVKPRTRPSEHTIHRTQAHLEMLLDASDRSGQARPDNLLLTYESASDLLSECDLCLTISSTVAIEALYSDIPTLIISDFGSHDDTGLPFFFGSGLIRDFAGIDPDNVPMVNRDWLEHVATDPEISLDKHIDELLAAARERSSSEGGHRFLHPVVASSARFDYLRELYSIDSIGFRAYERSKNKLTRPFINLYLSFTRFLANRIFRNMRPHRPNQTREN